MTDVREKELEQRIDNLESAFRDLVQRFLPPVMHRLQTLEARINRVDKPSSGPRRYQHTNYAAWRAVQERLGTMSYMQIAKELDLPYSTVRLYIAMPPEKVAQLRAIAEAEAKAEVPVEQSGNSEAEAAATEPSITRSNPIASGGPDTYMRVTDLMDRSQATGHAAKVPYYMRSEVRDE